MAGALPGLPPPRPIPIKDRSSIVFVEKGQIDVLDGAFVVIDVNGVRTHIPVGGFACLMLKPGTRVSHAAVALAARAGTLLVWVGEAGVRLYASGQPGGARADRLLWQARFALDETARLKVVRKMFELRFGEPAPERRSVDQLRGIEGVRVRTLYEHLARQHGINWNRRAYDRQDWQPSDMPNRCLSAATACLYGITEAAVLAAGYAPAVGFLHSGKPLSFVIAASPCLSSMTSATSSSSRPWCPPLSRLPPRPPKAVSTCRSRAPSGAPAATCFAGPACWSG
jgi:CRISP-associated protein Cas1